MNQEVDRSISFIVPALNEAERINETVDEIIRAAEQALEDYEVILVDDGSTDQTVEVMNSLADNNEHIHVVCHESNRGMGAAYKTGLKNSKMNYVMLIPGDNQFPAESIIPVLSIVGKADIVIPYHVNASIARSFRRRFLSDAFTSIANQLSGLKIPYYNGTVVHRSDIVKEIEIKTDGFAYQLEALVKILKQGKSYETVGIELKEREGGETKAFHWRNLLQVMSVFLGLMFKK